MNKEFWKAALIRAFRTFLQVILAVWTAGQLITEVDWKFLLLSAFSSAVYSLLTSILAGLPEVALADTLYELDNAPDEEDDIEEVGDGTEDDDDIEDGDE
jgi:hypothetical protein